MIKPKVNPSIDLNLIDSLIKQYDNPMDIFRENGLMMQLKKAIVERVMEGELTTELGYEKNAPSGNNSGNSRNGYTEKTLKCNDGHLPIKVPRDRNGDYEPKIIPKNQTRFDDMDEKIISLYARGMTTRDIQNQLKDLYHVDVSATLIFSRSNMENLVDQYAIAIAEIKLVYLISKQRLVGTFYVVMTM